MMIWSPLRRRQNRLGSRACFCRRKKTSYVDEKDAMDHLAGYALHNDYSERAFQLERSGQWVKGKVVTPSHHLVRS